MMWVCCFCDKAREIKSYYRQLQLKLMSAYKFHKMKMDYLTDFLIGSISGCIYYNTSICRVYHFKIIVVLARSELFRGTINNSHREREVSRKSLYPSLSFSIELFSVNGVINIPSFYTHTQDAYSEMFFEKILDVFLLLKIIIQNNQIYCLYAYIYVTYEKKLILNVYNFHKFRLGISLFKDKADFAVARQRGTVYLLWQSAMQGRRDASPRIFIIIIWRCYTRHFRKHNNHTFLVNILILFRQSFMKRDKSDFHDSSFPLLWIIIIENQ